MSHVRILPAVVHPLPVALSLTSVALSALVLSSCAARSPAQIPVTDTTAVAHPAEPRDFPPARAEDTTATTRRDVRPAILPDGAPSVQDRLADWERRFPGEPVPSSVVFDRPVGDAALRALLERHRARPYAGYARIAGVGGTHHVQGGRGGMEVIEYTRATALQAGRQSICHNAERMESWAIEVPAGWPAPALLDQARAMLAQHAAASRAVRVVEAGAPVIFAVEVLIAPGEVASLAAADGVSAVEPALMFDDARGIVPVPQALPVHDVAAPVISEELRRLSPDALIERMRAVGTAPRDCERRFPPPPSVATPDTIAPEERPLPTIPPAVHPVFRIAGGALGTLRPNEPVDIVARVEADAVVDTMEFLITLPELADARRAGWGATYDRLGIGVPYPPLDHVTGRMEPGTPLLLRRRVIFRAPGYYMVSMVVRARTRPVTEQRLPTVDEAFHSFMIWIDEDGGFAATDVDPTRYPIGSETQGGPVRMPPARAEERVLIERARTDPVTHATVGGTVRSPDGRPVSGIRITGRAFMERCPGRGVAEAVMRTTTAGRYTLELPAWPAESFIACVAIHADPPVGSGFAPKSLQTEVRFLRSPGAPHEIDLTLEPAAPVHDPARALPLPDAVRVVADAAAYSAITRTLSVDVTGDGRVDRVELSADAGLNARGEPIFEDGHRWRVIVRTAAGAFPLSDDFVPSGDVRIRTESRPIDEPDAPPAIVIAWRSRESWGERRVRYDEETRTFVTESIVRVTPE